MKKEIIIFCAVFLFFGCSRPSKVETYLKSNEPNLMTLEVIEEIEDSAFTPYDQLMSLPIIYMNTTIKINKLGTKALEAKNKKESIKYLDSALNVYNDTYNEYDSIVNKCFKAIDYPLLSKLGKNRKCIKAKIRLNGKLSDRILYFNENGIGISHTNLDNKKFGKDLFNAIEEARKANKETEQDMRDIKNGKLKLSTWK